MRSVWDGFAHPARIVPLAFLAAIVVGTALLSLPYSTPGPARPPVLTAAFTSVSAVCVTGLVTVDTATYWSPFGQVVILGLIQVGGFGIMTLATLLGVLVGARLRSQLLPGRPGRDPRTQRRRRPARGPPGRGHHARLRGRPRGRADAPVPGRLRRRLAARPLWHGVFHSVSAFNNAGFALYSDNLIGFAADAWICCRSVRASSSAASASPCCSSCAAGGGTRGVVGAHPADRVRLAAPARGVGTVAFLALEWSNPGTLGTDVAVGASSSAAVTGGVMPRTAGFNSVDYAAMTPETMIVNDVLMFIGGGSAGTAGGIKVTTFFLLAFVIWTEVRGERDTNIAHRRIGSPTMRQALTVALLGVAVVAAGTMALLLATDLPTRRRAVRDDLRVRHRRPVHRHHRRTCRRPRS